MALKHQHLLLIADMHKNITDLDFVEDWIERLIASLNMRTLYGPFSVYCDLAGNEGITAGALLSTSHIILHTFFEDVGKYTLQLDIYTCSILQLEVITSFLEELGAYNYRYKLLDRESKFITLIEKSS